MASYKDILCHYDPEKQLLVSYSFKDVKHSVVLRFEDGFRTSAGTVIEMVLFRLANRFQSNGLQKPGNNDKEFFFLKEMQGNKFLDPCLPLAQQGIDSRSFLVLQHVSTKNALVGGAPKKKLAKKPAKIPASATVCFDFKNGQCLKNPCSSRTQ